MITALAFLIHSKKKVKEFKLPKAPNNPNRKKQKQKQTQGQQYTLNRKRERGYWVVLLELWLIHTSPLHELISARGQQEWKSEQRRGLQMGLDCRESLPTFNCWSWDQEKKHHEQVGNSETPRAWFHSRTGSLWTNEHFTELITRLQIKSLLTYSVPYRAHKPKVLVENALQLAPRAHVVKSRVLDLIHGVWEYRWL